MSEQKLIRGWATGSAGVKIRLAKADHLPAIAELAPETGQELGPRMTTIIRDGVMGTAHRAGLAARGRDNRQEAFSRALAEAAGRHGPDQAFSVTSLVLVAEHPEHGVIGTAITFSPANVAEQYAEHAQRAGAPPREITGILLSSVIALAKVSTLAVAESFRGSGIGAALLSRVKKVFFANGYQYVYGQIPAERPHLVGFYRRAGFDVLEPDEGLDLWTVFGIPGGIRPDRGERFFVHTNAPG